MSDALFQNFSSKQEERKIKKHNSYCAVCDTRLSPDAIFCLVCDPPLPPGVEPEETGISFRQALLRILILVTLFVAIVFGKLEVPFDGLLVDKNNIINQETLAENEQPKDKDFQTIHTIVVSSANIRSKPSIQGEIVLTAEKGTDLEVIVSEKNWSKVRVLEKIGWISNKLFKSEIIAP